MKRTVLLLFCAVLLLVGCAAPSVSNDSGEAPLPLTWWIVRGEDSSYYPSYDENPAARYFETMTFNGRKIDLHFLVPLSGAELDNFNTLLATEDYAMIMDMQHSTTSAAELYEDGIIYDLTPYIDEYMPNYKRVLEEHAEESQFLYSNVNGEQKILTVCLVTNEYVGNFMGWLYRRDWVAKYGTNPSTGAAFTYSKDENGWHDDVVFPSWYNEELKSFYLSVDPDWDGSDPVYLSDWEWMFDIFTKAQNDLGVTDGYCISILYKGYHEDGALFSAFGGCTPLWYLTPEQNAGFGGDSASMQAYLECMHTWYEKGWLDRQFAERTTDQAFSINTAASHAGKVGMFIGRRAETGDLLDVPEMPLTEGIMTYGAYQPINDLYGGDDVKMKVPYSMYQYERVRGSNVITKKVAEEDLPTVLRFLDYLYTTEGGLKIVLGLTKEEVAEIQDPTYAKFGLEYSYYADGVDEKGIPVYVRNEKTREDNDLAIALAGKRMMAGLYDWGFVPALNSSYTIYGQQAMAAWDHYKNYGFISKNTSAQFTVEESSDFNKIWANVDTY
ncbi:MAG: hypothetical protein IJ138_05220, partial [Clostridia bacterium]|nr:hypothetical protein [Clostridia bacterium]